jgi:hypothetical protein
VIVSFMVQARLWVALLWIIVTHPYSDVIFRFITIIYFKLKLSVSIQHHTIKA